MLVIMMVLGGGFDAEACVNDMDKDKKSNVRSKAIPKGGSKVAPKNKVNKAQEKTTKPDVVKPDAKKEAPSNEKSSPQKSSKEEVAAKKIPENKDKKKEIEANTRKDKEAQPTACSSFNLSMSLWGLCAFVPFMMVRRR